MPDPNLPPGVTERMIDAMFNDPGHCSRCGVESCDLQGAMTRNRRHDLCPSCYAGYEEACEARGKERREEARDAE